MFNSITDQCPVIIRSRIVSTVSKLKQNVARRRLFGG